MAKKNLLRSPQNIYKFAISFCIDHQIEKEKVSDEEELSHADSMTLDDDDDDEDDDDDNGEPDDGHPRTGESL